MDIGQAVQIEIIDKLKQSIINNDMVATKALLNSVRFEQKESLQEIVIEIYALDYIVGLNDGIEPNKKPFPDIADIEVWLSAKGLNLNPWAVRANIIKNGTTWYQQGGSDVVTENINSEAFKKVIELASPEIKLKIKKEWQLLLKNNR